MSGVAAALDAAGFSYERIPHVAGRPHVLRLHVIDENGHFVVLFFAREAEELIRCSARFPDRVPSECFNAVLETMMRANLTMNAGAFTIDQDSGAAQVWTTTAVSSDEAVPATAMLMTCWNAAARFKRVLEAVVIEGQDPASAVSGFW